MSDANTLERFLIRELYSRYALGSAKRDMDAWLACWSETARWITPHFEKTGKAELREAWDAIWVNFGNVAPFNEVAVTEIAGGKAKAECCVLEIIRLAGGGLMKMAGLYHDELVEEDGAWRFASRTYELLSQEMAA